MFKKIILCVTLAVMSLVSKAQLEGSISAFSPYTMYGIGDLAVGGNISSRAMGGLGVGMRDPYEFNYLNPASLSSIPQRSAIFNFALASQNYYQQMGDKTNSYNSVDLHDLAFAIPLAKGVGLGFSLTPLSAVGYKTMVVDNNPDVTSEIGRAVYSYYGDGGVSELNASVGAKLFAGLSLGATMHYQFGTIDRTWTADIYSLLDNTDYRTLTSIERMFISKIRFSFGAQYQVRVGLEDNLTFGATYAPESNGSFENTTLALTTSTTIIDTVSMGTANFNAVMPAKYAAGVYFNNAKLGVGLDYTYQDWSGAFETPDNITLAATNDYRFGARYTPDRNSVRSWFARMTYKAGFRYATSYIVKDGHQTNNWNVSLGFDMPLQSRNFSAFNFGVEYGERGAYQAVLNEKYFRVFFGVSLFGGDDMWFVKRKFD